MHVYAIKRARIRILATAIAVCATAVPESFARAATQPTAVPSAAASPAVPISVAPGCSYKTLNSGMNFGGPVTINGKGYNFFTVTFTNNASVAATTIDFQIDFAKASRIVIPDVGTFAPGSTDTQTFRDRGKGMIFSARPTPNDGSVICTVLSAQFADGTAYTAPPAPVTSPTP